MVYEWLDRVHVWLDVVHEWLDVVWNGWVCLEWLSVFGRC